MRLLPDKEGNLNGVISSAACTGRITLPIGARYHMLAIKWTYNSSTFNLADITNLQLKANGKALFSLTATEIDNRNQILGYSASGTTGILVIPIERYDVQLRAYEEDTALNTGVMDNEGRIIQTLELEASFSGDQTTTGVEVYSWISPVLLKNAIGEPYGPGTIQHIIRHPFTTISAAGTVLINDIPKTGSEFKALERILVWSTNDVVTNIEVQKNRVTVFDLPSTIIDIVNPNGVRVNLANYQVADFTFNGDGRPDAPLVLVDANSIDIKLTVSGDMGASGYLYLDYLGSIGK